MTTEEFCNALADFERYLHCDVTTLIDFLRLGNDDGIL